MSNAEKIKLIRVFIYAMRQGNTTEVAKLPQNAAFSTNALGVCDIFEALCDGDLKRAMAHAEDMPLRMMLAAREEGHMRLSYAYVLAFAAMVPLANWMLGNVGTCSANGPCVIPVWPGIMAPSGVLAIGVAFVLRDLVQRRLGRFWSLSAIAIGAGVSLLVSPPAIALASIVAYVVSELTDFAVYTGLIGRGLVVAVAVSGIAASVIDSAAFLAIGFGSLAFMPGQVIGKAWSIIAALPIVATLRARA